MSWSLPHLPPPDSFFQQGQKHTISNFRGGHTHRGGAYAPPVLKQGGHMHTVPHGCARLCVSPYNRSLNSVQFVLIFPKHKLLVESHPVPPFLFTTISNLSLSPIFYLLLPLFLLIYIFFITLIVI